jgi:hypothetical protein
MEILFLLGIRGIAMLIHPTIGILNRFNYSELSPGEHDRSTPFE